MLILVTGAFCLITFVIVAAWTVGLTRIEKAAIVVSLTGFVTAGIATHVMAKMAGAQLSQPSGKFLLNLSWASLAIVVVGATLLLVSGLFHICTERRRIFPFMRKNAGKPGP